MNWILWPWNRPDVKRSLTLGLSCVVCCPIVLSVLSRSSWANDVCNGAEFNTELINTETLDSATDDTWGIPITVIGHLPGHNYVVVVPGRQDDLLESVRTYVPDAFMSSSRLGAYVHAGAFETRSEAESLSMRLRACKIRSRVVYFRRGRPV